MWNAPLPPEENVQVLKILARSTASRINSGPLRDDLLSLIDRGDFGALALSTKVSYDLSALSVFDALYVRQTLAFFQKNASLDFGLDCEAAARNTFRETEDICRETNVRFRNLASLPPTQVGGVDVSSVLFAAQRKIAKVLGPRVPPLKELPLVFGPGATTCVKKKNACARTKLSARPTCSTNAVSLLPEFFGAWPLYADLHGTEVDRGNEDYVITLIDVEIADGKLGFVPKNAKTHRSVLVEPTINGVIQGAYGKYITRRLRRVGVDLTDQSINRRKARAGSLTGALATLDLSSASDLISKELVAHLLPVDWYCALSACRTSVAVDGEHRYILEKFSSMGNGYTFPLQSLIFWALTTACQDTFLDATEVSVYGDDIICPVANVQRVIDVFQFCGFKVNTEKSYWEGPFRESCGGDYYLGVNIRPLYIKGAISQKTLFALHNFYVRGFEADLAAEALELIPEKDRLWGPDGFGDGHLLGDWRPRAHRRDQGWSGWLFDTYREIGARHKRALPGDSILPAYTVYVNTPENWSYVESDGKYTIEHRECSAPLSKGRGGIPQLALPGVVKYKRVTLYTLRP